MKEIRKRFVLALLLLAVAAGCSTIRATSEYNTDIAFDHFHAYAWLPVPEGMKGGNTVTDYAKEIVDSQLKARGYVPDVESPDFFVALLVGEGKSVDVSAGGYRYGEAPYYHNFHVPYEGTPKDHIHFEYRFDMNKRTYGDGTLILDFIERQTREMVWRGIATSVVDESMPSEELQKRILKGVTEILGTFPPY